MGGIRWKCSEAELPVGPETCSAMLRLIENATGTFLVNIYIAYHIHFFGGGNYLIDPESEALHLLDLLIRPDMPPQICQIQVQGFRLKTITC